MGVIGNRAVSHWHFNCPICACNTRIAEALLTVSFAVSRDGIQMNQTSSKKVIDVFSFLCNAHVGVKPNIPNI